MPSRRIPGRAVAALAVALAAVLVAASTTLVTRQARRAYCSSGYFQYEYTAGFLDINSYANVVLRVCLPPRGASPQFVDVRVRVTVSGFVGRNVYVFETDRTWADVEVVADGRVETRRCDFRGVSRMTPYTLHYGHIGEDRALVEHCRVDVLRGDRVTVRATFHGEEQKGPHRPDSVPVSVERDADETRCTRGARVVGCSRVIL